MKMSLMLPVHTSRTHWIINVARRDKQQKTKFLLVGKLLTAGRLWRGVPQGVRRWRLPATEEVVDLTLCLGRRWSIYPINAHFEPGLCEFLRKSCNLFSR